MNDSGIIMRMVETPEKMFLKVPVCAKAFPNDDAFLNQKTKNTCMSGTIQKKLK